MQWFGLQHDVLTTERSGNNKWTLSDEWLRRRGLLRPANAAERPRRIDAAASGRNKAELTKTAADKDKDKKVILMGL